MEQPKEQPDVALPDWRWKQIEVMPAAIKAAIAEGNTASVNVALDIAALVGDRTAKEERSPKPPEWLTSPEIVVRFGLIKKRAALQTRLKRWRRLHDDGWKEVQNSRRNEPSFLYRADAIQGIIDDLKSE
ncbi:MAG: hypothetical protein IT427_05790 [Pirellulales bacterium]|nr:hypothetical protein [Pirellulales bacterium]